MASLLEHRVAHNLHSRTSHSRISQFAVGCHSWMSQFQLSIPQLDFPQRLIHTATGAPLAAASSSSAALELGLGLAHDSYYAWWLRPGPSQSTRQCSTSWTAFSGLSADAIGACLPEQLKFWVKGRVDEVASSSTSETQGAGTHGVLLQLWKHKGFKFTSRRGAGGQSGPAPCGLEAARAPPAPG